MFGRHSAIASLVFASCLAAGASPRAFAGEPPRGPGKLLELGKPVPAFKLRALDGAMVRLDEIAYPGKEKRWAKKRPLLLDFFRTDCGPCRTAMPDLVAFYKAHKDEGLEVVLVALIEPEDGRGKLERYLAEQRLPFTVVVDETEHFAKKYLGKTVQLPATFLIDRDGKLVKSKYGAGGSFAAHFGPSLESVMVPAGGK